MFQKKIVSLHSMKLSVIIPVYNTEKTLKRCLDSVLAQSLTNYELILVNDGSTDCSQNVCEEYVLKQPLNITLINQENKGLSEARNTGLKVATGDYISFVDSDDFLAPNTYKDVLYVIKHHPEIDLLEYSYMQLYQDKNLYTKHFFNDIIYINKQDYWLKGRAYKHTYAWNKVYKKELFENVRYPFGKKFEDVYMMGILLQKAQIIASTSKGTYYYVFNKNGITANADGLALKNLLEAHLTIQPFYCDAAYYKHLLNIQLDVSEHLHSKNELPLMPYYSGLKLILLHLLGFNLLCKINIWIHKIYRRSP